MKFVIAIGVIVGVLLPSSDICAQGCGLKPLKPLVPLECRDLVLRCLCDVNGKNCQWQWLCVPKR